MFTGGIRISMGEKPVTETQIVVRVVAVEVGVVNQEEEREREGVMWWKNRQQM